MKKMILSILLLFLLMAPVLAEGKTFKPATIRGLTLDKNINRSSVNNSPKLDLSKPPLENEEAENNISKTPNAIEIETLNKLYNDSLTIMADLEIFKAGLSSDLSLDEMRDKMFTFIKIIEDIEKILEETKTIDPYNSMGLDIEEFKIKVNENKKLMESLVKILS